MTQAELVKIVEEHNRWLLDFLDGKRADLRNANLTHLNLRHVDLQYANLQGADLHCLDLRHADLQNANLKGADLHGADLRHANLKYALLQGADLQGANLQSADLENADISDAKNIPYIPMRCPDTGAFVGWKVARTNKATPAYIVKLLIPEDAKRSSSTGMKCRCDKAIVLAIETLDGKSADIDTVHSIFRPTFIYKVGEIVVVPDFCDNRFKECAPGIHFFVNRQEAVNYVAV